MYGTPVLSGCTATLSWGCISEVFGERVKGRRMARAALYLRVSSSGQEDNYSLPGQESDVRRWCEQNGHEIVLVLNDGAQKSHTLDREELNEAVMRARKGDFDVLVVGKWDRLSRNQVQQHVIIYQFDKYGVKVVSANEPIPEGAIGSFIRASYAFTAENELYNIRFRTTGGKKSRVRAGKLLTGSHPLYGYVWTNADVKHGKDAYLEDPETAWVVQLIYELVLSGLPLRAVAHELESRQIPTPGQILARRGQLQKGRTFSTNWRLSTLGRILSNKAYIGKHSGWRTSRETVHEKDAITGEVRAITRQVELSPDSPERVFFSTDVCPALVSEEDYKAVQTVLARNKQLASRRTMDPEAILLRGGFAVCGWCGRNLQPRLDHRIYYRYYCGSVHQVESNRCPNGYWSVKAEDLDYLVWNWVVRAFEKPEIIRAAFERWKANQEDGRTFEYDRLDSIQTALTNATNRWCNCLKSAAGASDETTRAQFTHMADEAAKEMKESQKDYDQLASVLSRTEARFEQIDAVIRMGTNALEHLRQADYQDKRTFLYTLGVVIKVKSMTDYKIDWRLEQINDQWVQAQLCVPDEVCSGIP